MKEVIERCNWLVNKCNDKDITPEVKDDFRYLLEEIERLNNIINDFEDWLKEKKEQMERFELYKRKETGAFWYSTMGNIETFIDKIEELKGSGKE